MMDEMFVGRWDDAEMRSFKAVYDTASREGALLPGSPASRAVDG